MNLIITYLIKFACKNLLYKCTLKLGGQIVANGGKIVKLQYMFHRMHNKL